LRLPVMLVLRALRKYQNIQQQNYWRNLQNPRSATLLLPVFSVPCLLSHPLHLAHLYRCVLKEK
jgi:hypothetical protein